MGIVGCVSAIILWDVYLASDDVKENTISHVVQDVAHKAPMIPFSLGVLIGHWLWDSGDEE
jgi:hypothetical protein